MAGKVVEQYVQDCERRARGASVSAPGTASPPPRRSMPSGLLAAGGHDVNWRSLRSAIRLALTALDACCACLATDRWPHVEHLQLRILLYAQHVEVLVSCRSSESYNPTQDVWMTASPLPDCISFAAYTSAQVWPVFFFSFSHKDMRDLTHAVVVLWS